MTTVTVLRRDVLVLILTFVCLSAALPTFTLPHLLARESPSPPSNDTRESAAPESILRSQWRNPKETLSVLLIIGGDIVQKAIAQMTGAIYLQIQRLPNQRQKERGAQRISDTVDEKSALREQENPKAVTEEIQVVQEPATHGDDRTSVSRDGNHIDDPKASGEHSSAFKAPIQKVGDASTVQHETAGAAEKPNVHDVHAPSAGNDAVKPEIQSLQEKGAHELKFVFVPLQRAIPYTTSARVWHLNVSPVAFSFGWVGYAFTSLMSIGGEGLLMPPTDTEAVVIDLDSGTKKMNENWVLGRLVRDLGISHTPRKRLRGSQPEPAVYFYKTTEGAGQSRLGLLWLASLMIPIQFLIASIPIWDPGRPSEERNWIILMITAIGTGLALLTGAIPQWQDERFPARRNMKRNFILSKGNGHATSYVILDPIGKHQSMNLEDLAVTRPEVLSSPYTKVYVPVLALCWVFLLLCIGGLERDTWFLFAVGLAGMIQNVILASLWKHPDTHGIPIEQATPGDDWVVEDEQHKIMPVLVKAELARPYVGIRLLGVFFGETVLKDREKGIWDALRDTVKAREERRKKQLQVDLLTADDEISFWKLGPQMASFASAMK